MIAQHGLAADAAILHSAQTLDHALRDASPAQVIETALKVVGRENLGHDEHQPRRGQVHAPGI